MNKKNQQKHDRKAMKYSDEQKESKFKRAKQRDIEGRGQYIKNSQTLISKEFISKASFIEITQVIEEISSFIITNPELYLNHIQTLFQLMEGNNLIVMKIACFSLTSIFKDITPQYQINYNQHMEKLKQQIKKDEKQVLLFESRIYEYYDKFIDMLFILLKNPPKNCNEQQFQIIQDNQLMAIKCLCELLNILYHFNKANIISSKICYSILSSQTEVANLCFQTIKNILQDKNHSLYDIKIHILREISKIIKARPEKDTPDNILDLVNTIEIDTQYIQKNIDEEKKIQSLDAKKRKKQFFLDLEKAKKDGKKIKNKIQQQISQKKLTEDEKKSERAMKKELKSELEEGLSELSPQKIAKKNSEILEIIFYIYFKIIKRESISKFFKSAMNGVLKYVHLINVDTIYSLVNNLYICCQTLRNQSKQLKNMSNLQQRLASIFTIEEIILGPGTAIEIEDKQAQLHFFHIIIDMNNLNKNIATYFDIPNQILFLRIFEKMFMKRRQFNYETIASFIKQLLILVKKSNPVDMMSISATIVFFVKQLLHKYPKTNRMIDEENYGFGLDMYNTKIEDPQTTNAINTTIHEDLIDIKKKFLDTDLQNLIGRILRQDPLQPAISSLTPLQFLEYHKKKTLQ